MIKRFFLLMVASAFLFYGCGGSDGTDLVASGDNTFQENIDPGPNPGNVVVTFPASVRAQAFVEGVLPSDPEYVRLVVKKFGQTGTKKEIDPAFPPVTECDPDEPEDCTTTYTYVDVPVYGESLRIVQDVAYSDGSASFELRPGTGYSLELLRYAKDTDFPGINFMIDYYRVIEETEAGGTKDTFDLEPGATKSITIPHFDKISAGLVFPESFDPQKLNTGIVSGETVTLDVVDGISPALRRNSYYDPAYSASTKADFDGYYIWCEDTDRLATRHTLTAPIVSENNTLMYVQGQFFISADLLKKSGENYKNWRFNHVAEYPVTAASEVVFE